MADVRATNLNLLLVFDALLTSGSVTLAGRRLGLTQSGTSNALAQLRILFGDPLFERHGHAMRPTPRALELAPDVRAGVGAFERALAPRRFDPLALERTFHLAMPDAVQQVVVPPLLAGLDAPGVRLRIETWAEQRVPEGLDHGELDLFAGFVGSIPEGCDGCALYDDAYAVLVRAGHPALRGGALDLDGWLAAGHVIVTTERSGPTGVDRALADLGLRRTVALRVDNALLVPAIVAATDLVAAVDRRWAEGALGPGLVLVEPPVALPRGRVRLVWSRRAASDPAARWLREQLVGAVSR